MSRTSGMTAREALAILGLTGPASPEAVKTAFRAAAKAARPDQGGDPERFRRVIEAYRVLQRLEVAREALAAPRTPPPETGPVLEITPQEAATGVSRSIRLPNGKTLGLRLPAGLRAGESVRLARQGPGGADLLMTVRVLNAPVCAAIGDDLWITAAIPARTLRDGGRVEIATPTGPRRVWVPKGLPEGARLRLKGQGLPARGAHRAGHLFVTLAPSSEEPRSAADDLLKRFSRAWTRG